jgi:hypothetical protein
MNNVLAVLVAGLMVGANISYGQLTNEFVPLLAPKYTYQFAKSNAPIIRSFYSAGEDTGTGWLRGPAAFGTLNNTGAPPCPLNIADNVNTPWPSSRDLLLRRHLSLPAGAHNLKVTVLVDNGVQVYFNGKDISGGINNHNDCATESGDLFFSVPDTLLAKPDPTTGLGNNVIAVRGVWLSAKNYFDMKVTGEVSYTVTVIQSAGGSITPAGPVTIYPDQTTQPTFTISPDDGFRIDNVVVDGVDQGKITTYTFTDLNSNHTIAASFSLIRYLLAVAPAANGFVTRSPDQIDYAPRTVVTLTAHANTGYHFSGWTGDLTGSSNPVTVTMSSDKAIAAGFESNVPLHLTVTEFTEKALTDAIGYANDNPGPDEILFTGSGTITLNGPLPVLTDEVKIEVSSGQSVTLEPSLSFPQDPSSTIFEISGVFLSWGYTPQHTTISGITVQDFPGSGICAQSNGNIIQGCTIMYNGSDGVCIEGGSGNLIGGTLPGQGNIIAYNGANGVTVRKGTGVPMPSGNGILGNKIYGNVELGIDLGGDGVTQNVYQPGPSHIIQRPNGPLLINYGQNFPNLFSASVGTGSTVKGSLLNWPQTHFRIEIFASDTVDLSGYGEGKWPVASQVVTTNDTGYIWFEIPTTTPLSWGQWVTATATDLTHDSTNTSEFSAAVPVGITTKRFGPGYVVNTTMSGIPLHWPDGRATYQLSPDVPSGFQDAIGQSFATWSQISGTLPGGAAWSVHYANGGTSPSQQFGGTPDGINNMVWINDDWVTTTGLDPNIIGVTRVRYNAINGEMTDVDIGFNVRSNMNPNGFKFDISPNPDGHSNDTTYRDVQNVVTHEAGHFSGLGDLYDPGYPSYVPMMGEGNQDFTMYGIIQGNETIKRSLALPDIDGITWIYEHAPQGRVELVLVFDGSSNFITQYGAFDAAKNSAAELIERMDAGDKVGIIQLPNTVVLPLHALTDGASRTAVIAAIENLAPGGTTNIGAGLQAGLSQLTSSAGGLDAMILFSAGEEIGLPAALSVVPGVNADNAHLFTLGFAGSTGQDLNSILADTTGGAYFLASSATMSTVVKEIWNRLTALQMIAYYSFLSNQEGFNWQGGFNCQGGFNWQGGFNYQGGFNWQGGFNYQGAVDDGTLKILPGFNWQGSSGQLALVPPQDNYTPPTTWVDGAIYTVPYGIAVITPDNWDQIPVPNQFFTSIRYVEGSTYSFYEVIGPKPGTWTLIPCGNDTNVTTVELLNLSIVGLTDVTMEVTFSSSTYEPGSPIHAQITLSQGGVSLGGEHVSGGTMISDATVAAEVSIPGVSTPSTLNLTPQGNGLYTGTFAETSIPGTYHFKFSASGKVTVTSATGPVQVSFTRLREQSVYVAYPFVANGVLVGEGSVTVGDASSVTSGSVLVNSKTGKLSIGAGVSTAARYSLKANTVSVGSGSIVASDVYYNTLTNSGTIGGSRITPLTLPLWSSPPKMVTGTPGMQDILLGNGQSMPLSPGPYRDVILSPQSVLTLSSGGTYSLRSIWVKSGAQLLFTDKTTVTISNGFRPDNGSYIGPANGTKITESDIVVYVAAKNSQSAFSTAVNIGPQARVYANIEATNGTIWIQDNSIVTGAFVSKDVLVGKGVKAALNTFFSGLKKGSGDGWGLAPEESSTRQEVPTAFSLAQNYPNPFNPATEIRFAVPVAGGVELKIFDLLGREITTLVNEVKQPGIYTVTWDAAAQASGVYFYRLKAGSFVDTKKLVLLR